MMRMKKVGGTRNFGYGRSMWYAVRCALAERYRHGRFGTQYTTRARLRLFLRHLKVVGVGELGQVTQTTVENYACVLREKVDNGDLQVSTAVNRLSAVNVVMEQLRGDRKCFVSPSKAIGRRTYVRRIAPVSIDRSPVSQAVDALIEANETRLAALLLLCRVYGLRLREASLLPAGDALGQARRYGEIEIVKGTKGGRRRTIPADEGRVQVLQFVKSAIGEDLCLVPRTWSYIRWCRFCYRTWRPIAGQMGLSTKFSDLRAGFACEKYEEVADRPAPVVTEGRTANRDADRAAREIVARDLGHGRGQIAGAYVGTTIRRKL